MSAPGASRRSQLLALLVPFAVYLVGVILLGEWLIDDAGISFAYARNAASGHGFVSQPGRAPVEGFSNFLWVLALVPTFWLHLFHPVVTAKVLGALAVLGAFALLQRALFRVTASLWPGAVAASFLALSPPIVIWTASGLENGLTLLLVAALFALVVLRPSRWQAASGLVAAMVAMTRPDGLVFFPPVALACLMEARANRRGTRWDLLPAGQYLGVFALVFGGFIGFRLAVFGLPLPHTYYAKREFLGVADHLRFIADRPETLWLKFSGLGHAVAGPVGLWFLLASAAALAALAFRRRLDRGLGAAVAMQLCAVAGFLWLEDDWMGEYRFATAAIATSAVVAVMAAYSLFTGSQHRTVTVGWAALLAVGLSEAGPRFWRFASNPPTPFAEVARETRRFNAWADQLALKKASVLAADVGAELLDSRLAVYDLAGLCEPEVVSTLKLGSTLWQYEHPLFYDWVFEVARPTFVVTRKFWSNVTTLEYDPRFARDYVPIDSFEDSYVARVYGRAVHSGEFVRRDALGAVDALARMRAALPQKEREAPLLVRLAERVGLAGPGEGASSDEVRQAAREARTARGDPNRAAALLERLVERDGAAPAVLVELGEALDDSGRNLEARPVWERLRRVAGERSDGALRDRAVARLGGGTPVSSEDEQRRLMESGLDALYRRSSPAEAAAAFRAVLNQRPTHYGATYQLAVALERAGQRDAALVLWEKVLELAEGYQDTNAAAEARKRLGR